MRIARWSVPYYTPANLDRRAALEKGVHKDANSRVMELFEKGPSSQP